MKKQNHFSLEQIWVYLLSREVKIILAAFNHLNKSERSAVIQHLEHMMIENGWHPEQKLSAEIALQTIHSATKGKNKK